MTDKNATITAYCLQDGLTVSVKRETYAKDMTLHHCYVLLQSRKRNLASVIRPVIMRSSLRLFKAKIKEEKKALQHPEGFLTLSPLTLQGPLVSFQRIPEIGSEKKRATSPPL